MKVFRFGWFWKCHKKLWISIFFRRINISMYSRSWLLFDKLSKIFRHTNSPGLTNMDSTINKVVVNNHFQHGRILSSNIFFASSYITFYCWAIILLQKCLGYKLIMIYFNYEFRNKVNVKWNIHMFSNLVNILLEKRLIYHHLNPTKAQCVSDNTRLP